MHQKLSLTSFSASFPMEENLSSSQVLIRLAAHLDRKIEIRGSIDGGWIFWISSRNSNVLSITSIKSLKPMFEEAFEHIASKVIEEDILKMSHCYTRSGVES